MATSGDRLHEFHQLEGEYKGIMRARREREEEINVGLPRPRPEPDSLRAIIFQLRIASMGGH